MGTTASSSKEKKEDQRNSQGPDGRPKLDPALEKSLKRMYTSHRTSNSSDRSKFSDNTHHTAQSSINDAFSPEVTNMACAYGSLHFHSGALFQGILCNRLDGFSGDEVELQELDTSIATFITSRGECLHGTWVFQRLQYDLRENSPLAVYFADLQVVQLDSSVHIYKGPVLVVLKSGKVLLPLAKSLLCDEGAKREKTGDANQNHEQQQQRENEKQEDKEEEEEEEEVGEEDEAGLSVVNMDRKKNAAKGKVLLQLTLSSESESSEIDAKKTPRFPYDVEYAKYPLASPRRNVSLSVCSEDGASGRPTSLLRRLTTSNIKNSGTETLSGSGSRSKVRRDHRMLFWSLCGKEMAPSKWDESINSDLHRTHFHRFLDRSSDTAREQLHSILRYVAIAFPNIGYCQGMHCVAKFLLVFSEAPISEANRTIESDPSLTPSSAGDSGSNRKLTSSVSLETETAFVLFAQLLEDSKYRLQDLFHPNFEFFRSLLDDIDQQLAQKEPVLFAHLEKLGVTAVIYATKWILTLFTFYVDQDFASVTNVWLRFLSQGWDALLQVAVACVVCVKEHLMNTDGEGCVLILSGTTQATPHGILETVFGTTRGQALLREKPVHAKLSLGSHTQSLTPNGLSSAGSAFNFQDPSSSTCSDAPTPRAVTPTPTSSEKCPSPSKGAKDHLPLPPRIPTKRGSFKIPAGGLVAAPRDGKDQVAVISRVVPNRRYTHD